MRPEPVASSVPTLDAWKALDTPVGSALLARCAELDLRHPGSIQSLRARFDSGLVEAAIELTLARRAAAEKFGQAAGRLWADRAGVEMASSPAAAEHKAARFASLGAGHPVHDLCCGIGADAAALVRAGLEVTGVDRDEIRAWMCARNAECRVRTADVASLQDVAAFHIDPQRRHGGQRRVPRLEDLEPRLDVVRSLVEGSRAGCVKLFPGVAFDPLPPGEIEVLSERARLRQALLWTGQLARHERSATVLDAGATLTGQPAPAPIGAIGPIVHTVDPAVERAQLIGALAAKTGLTTPHGASGLLTGRQAVTSPFLRAFRLIEQMPWSISKVRRRLVDLDAGIVSIKTRGGAVDPDRLQSRLRGKGARPLVLFVQRFGERMVCLICEALV